VGELQHDVSIIKHKLVHIMFLIVLLQLHVDEDLVGSHISFLYFVTGKEDG
jgi:hypothetical protein